MPANSRWDLIQGLKGYIEMLMKKCITVKFGGRNKAVKGTNL